MAGCGCGYIAYVRSRQHVTVYGLEPLTCNVTDIILRVRTGCILSDAFRSLVSRSVCKSVTKLNYFIVSVQTGNYVAYQSDSISHISFDADSGTTRKSENDTANAFVVFSL